MQGLLHRPTLGSLQGFGLGTHRKRGRVEPFAVARRFDRRSGRHHSKPGDRVSRKMSGFDPVARFGQQRGGAQHPLQLPQVARPPARGQLGQRGRGQSHQTGMGQAVQHALRQVAQVAALAQRRQVHGQPLQAVKKVLTQSTRPGADAQRMTAGTDEPKGRLVQPVQQLRLQRRRQLADTVQVQRAAFGALHRTFQFGCRHRSARHGHKGRQGAMAVAVQRAGQQVLAGARLAEQDHGHAVVPHPLQLVQDSRHLDITADQRSQAAGRRHGLAWPTRCLQRLRQRC